ncbi:hypothetical protein LJC46_03580 [Desulfovibrio sp. OttesenSCG-928-G15]|nr:hypothetical protein [Desulfovibrio sp. OttesenSCG-928-G15]
MKKAATDTFSEEIILRNDSGTELRFCGRLYSESSYYDEETATLTQLRLYLAINGEQVYSIVSGSGHEKYRRFYTVAQEGELFRISDGFNTLMLPLEMLFASVFGLCGIDPTRAEDLKPEFEETLRVTVG